MVVYVDDCGDVEKQRFAAALVDEQLSEDGKYARQAIACIGIKWQFKKA
jgi:hypothetical protein